MSNVKTEHLPKFVQKENSLWKSHQKTKYVNKEFFCFF